MANLFVKKPIENVIREAEGKSGLNRTLNAFSLILLGIGAIVGAGIFIRTASAAADFAGPSVTYAYVLAGFGSVFAGLCYAEFASRIPIAGSAYTYTYVTLGEFTAWMIGWNLILEYAIGAATVSIAWSEYFDKLLNYFNLSIAYEWSHSPFQSITDSAGAIRYGIINIPAIAIVIFVSLLLMRGMKGSALVNNLIVMIKLTIIVLFVLIGWQFINPANLTPYIPDPTIYVDSVGESHHFGGFSGILSAAGVVFFAYIGFDAISTAAQETINPKRTMPIGILGSLFICTFLYIVFAYVLTGVASTEDLRTQGMEASVTYAVQTYMTGYGWFAKFVTVAILIGLTSVLLVLLFGQSRIFYSMSKDGLVPKLFSDTHLRFQTPIKSNLLFMVFTGLIAAFIPGDIIGNMTSIGTLFAYCFVCVGIILLRRMAPLTEGHFRTPAVPLVPILGILVCSIMIYGLGYLNWLRLILWLILGVVIYFSYSRFHSKLNNKKFDISPTG